MNRQIHCEHVFREISQLSHRKKEYFEHIRQRNPIFGGRKNVLSTPEQLLLSYQFK